MWCFLCIFSFVIYILSNHFIIVYVPAEAALSLKVCFTLIILHGTNLQFTVLVYCQVSRLKILQKKNIYYCTELLTVSSNACTVLYQSWHLAVCLNATEGILNRYLTTWLNNKLIMGPCRVIHRAL